MVPILDLLLAASQLYEAQEEEVLDEKYGWMQDEDFAYGRLIEGVQCDAGPLENEHEHGYDGKCGAKPGRLQICCSCHWKGYIAEDRGSNTKGNPKDNVMGS